MLINLVDNRRYYLENEVNKDNENIFKISSLHFNILKNLPNPLTTDSLDGVEFLEQKNDESETLVLKIVTNNNETYIQTGNMIGNFYFKAHQKIHQINIGLRFDDNDNNTILEYLINYANTIYPKKIDLNTAQQNNKKSNNITWIILAKMFSNSLSKAYVMGLPTYYESFERSDYNVQGNIDINRLIAKELPFKGITPYLINERVIEKNIGSILLKAINMVEYKVRSFTILSQIKTTLKQSNIKPIVTDITLQKALNSRVLRNISYSEYNNSLKLALMIIQGFKIPNFKNSNDIFYGYLTNISKIWENYLVKLLAINFSDEWDIEVEPELKLFKYKPNLHKLKNVMYPDIVLKHKRDKKVIIFDAKFKNSQWFNREDFYKTATYISFYQNQEDKYRVVLSGQIYPDKDADRINKNLGFLNSGIDFRILGIDLMNEMIEKKESDFINEIQKVTNEFK